MIVLAGQIESIASRKDKTVKVSLGTQELTPNQAAELFSLNQQFCYLAIKNESFTNDEVIQIDNLKTELDSIKSPSQRLRNILYRNYEQDNQGYKDFNTYYIGSMEKICEHFKNKLDV